MPISRSCDGSAFYTGKTILAPMVHAGRTPLRLLALEYGADLVYTEEIVDQRLLNSRRVVNDLLHTVDYVIEEDVVLRVAMERERNKCVLQVGTNSGDRIAAVARKVHDDIAAIDVNMGCPKPFSLTGGMGAALLTQPDKVKEILTSLVSVSSVPVSCKIRVLDKLEDTLALVKLIEKCGVAAIGVHGRRRDERQGDANRVDEIREVVRALSIPVIANGASGIVKEFKDVEQFRRESEASSIMLARRALSNPSVFRPQGLLTMQEEITDFLKLACEFDENFTMTKYVVQRILGNQQEFDPRGRATVLAASVSDICAAWSMRDVYENFKNQRLRGNKRKEVSDAETGIHFIDLTFPPKRLRDRCGARTPKCVLKELCDESGIKRPIYYCKFRPNDKRYEALIEVDGCKFLSRIGQPNKRMAEQVAALTALVGLGKRERLEGNWEE
uniref:DRBM domain-containing protein n=1 Tax=Parascaris univalens TaxID=6257 RepID=A0A915BD79_PARUN